jgi:hypothetical protein
MGLYINRTLPEGAFIGYYGGVTSVEPYIGSRHLVWFPSYHDVRSNMRDGGAIQHLLSPIYIEGALDLELLHAIEAKTDRLFLYELQ